MPPCRSHAFPSFTHLPVVHTHPISKPHGPPSTIFSAPCAHVATLLCHCVHPPGPTIAALHGTAHHCLDSGHCRWGWCIYTGWALSLADLGIWAKTRFSSQESQYPVRITICM